MPFEVAMLKVISLKYVLSVWMMCSSPLITMLNVTFTSFLLHLIPFEVHNATLFTALCTAFADTPSRGVSVVLERLWQSHNRGIMRRRTSRSASHFCFCLWPTAACKTSRRVFSRWDAGTSLRVTSSSLHIQDNNTACESFTGGINIFVLFFFLI